MEKKINSTLTRRYVLGNDVKLRETPYEAHAQALQRLRDHLADKHKKQTSERECILDILYRTDVLLEAQTLHSLVCENHSLISPASVYNTLLLFQEIGIVRKIMLFNDSLTFYERSLGNPAHPFAVCPHCKTVWSLPPMDFAQQFDNLLPTRFSSLGHSMIIDGICQKCAQRRKKESIAEEKAYQEARASKEKKRLKAKAKKQKKTNKK